MSIVNLSAAHAFNYIVLRVKPGLTSCEDLAMALDMHTCTRRDKQTDTCTHTHTHTHTLTFSTPVTFTLHTIMLLNFPIILSGNSFLSPPIIFKNILTQIALLTKNPCKLANKPYKITFKYK